MSEEKTPEQVIELLKEIANKSGYLFYFEDVDIDLVGKEFIIKGKGGKNV